jgi:2'-5' RNA ligase
MRVFFAIEFSKEIKELLKSIEHELEDNSISGNFTTEENMHLTVKFIGEIENKEFEKLKVCLDKATVNMGPFAIRLTQLGEFAGGGSELIWVGIENQDDGLINLFNNIQKEIEAAGYEKEERKFRPHITIGRKVKLKEEFNYSDINFKAQDMIVNNVVIMESSRINGKLTYTPIYKVNIL